MEISKSYKGREHSYIKHELLKGYLEALFSIVAVAGAQRENSTREFVYVDCFAGPWGDESEALTGTSIAISLEILAKIRDLLDARFEPGHSRFKAVYVEENRRRFTRLQEYLNGSCPPGIECHALHGDYWRLQDEILQLCGERAFAFFFVDPLGWTDVSVPKLKRLLRRPRTEFLINFMYDFLNRAIGMKDFQAQVSQMLGMLSDDDRNALSSLTGPERAEWVVRRYRDALTQEMGPDGAYPARSFHAEILHKERERVLYHLVYLTRHHKGIVKFAEASERVSLVQRVVRLQTKQDHDPNLSLFSAEEQVLHEGMLGNSNLEDVRAYWLSVLTPEPKRFGELELAAMLEQTGWLTGDLQEAFKELAAEGKVENLDGSPRRTKHFIHFDKGERLRRCA
ncbi:MAG: three-Cys-motif partner protein TcmP [Thiohalomonadaceae bacterium]